MGVPPQQFLFLKPKMLRVLIVTYVEKDGFIRSQELYFQVIEMWQLNGCFMRQGGNEDEFVATARKLGYPILAHKMTATAAAAMWQESNVSIRSQRIILRHMANKFGKRLVVPEKYIYKLGENFVKPNCNKCRWEKEKKIYIIGPNHFQMFW